VGEEVSASEDGVSRDGEGSPAASAEAAGAASGRLSREDTGRRFIRHTAVMSVGTALSRITGFLRLSAMAYAIGVAHSRVADAYNVANNTPNIVYELVLGGILTSVFVPVFVEWLDARGRDQAWDVARSVLTFTLVVLTAIMLVTILVAPLLVRLYTLRLSGSGAEAERDLATFFLRWFMPQIVFYGLGAVITGLLNAHRKFAVPMFAPILNNLIVIGTMIAFAAMPGGSDISGSDAITGAQKLVLALGTTLGVVAMTLVLLPSLRRVGFRFRWRFDWGHEAVRRIARLSLWVFVYVAVNQLGLLVVIVLGAGKLEYTAYNSAFILFQLPHAIFAVSIMTALLPALSSRWAEGDRDGFRLLLARGLRSTAFIVVPAAFGYIVLAEPIVRLLLQHGAAAQGITSEVTGDVLVFFSIGLFQFSAFQLLLRAYYATQDTRTPALINVAAVALNTAVNFLYFFTFGLGVRGLALGHATAYTFAAIVAAVLMRRKLGGLEGRVVLGGIAKVLTGAAVTAAAAFGTSKVLGSLVDTHSVAGQLAQVTGSVAVGLLVFVLAALVLRMEDLQLVKEFVVARVRPGTHTER
jgi:putative peptidoglycan lipid II flippase